MPAASQRAESGSHGDRLFQAIALLKQALEILDALDERTAAGARLQDLIDQLADDLEVRA